MRKTKTTTPTRRAAEVGRLYDQIARRTAEQIKINEAAAKEAIRKEAAKLVNWLHH